MDIATAMELASKNLKDLGTKADNMAPTKVHRVESKQAAGKSKVLKECYRCGGKHEVSTCKHKESKCFLCSKVGHLARVCRSKKKSDTAAKPQAREEKRDAAKEKSSTNKLTDSQMGEEYMLYSLKAGKAGEPITVKLELCNEELEMELDTGASKTILNESTFNRLRGKLDAPLQETRAVLNTYTGETVKVLGKAVDIPVKYGSQNLLLSALVVQNHGPNLFGRDWLEKVKLDWGQIFQVTGNTMVKLEQLLTKHKELFGEDLGTLKGTKAKIYVDENATPKFFKARPVPYALKGKIDHELDRLQQQGVISPVVFWLLQLCL